MREILAVVYGVSALIRSVGGFEREGVNCERSRVNKDRARHVPRFVYGLGRGASGMYIEPGRCSAGPGGYCP